MRQLEAYNNMSLSDMVGNFSAADILAAWPTEGGPKAATPVKESRYRDPMGSCL